jgi:hypothetical protein
MQNTQIITFTQSCIDQKWYVRLPDYKGSHSDLEMVEGAEDLLSIIANGMRIVQMHVAETPIDQAPFVFHKTDETTDEKGANYQLIHNGYHAQKVWLCGVMEHVFQGFPEILYAQPLELSEKMKEIKEGFFDAAKHFRMNRQLAKREWTLLEDTGLWLLWEAMAHWTNLTQREDIGWFFGDFQVLQFLSFRSFLFLPKKDNFQENGLPERYIARTRYYPNELTIIVNDPYVEKANSFFTEHFQGQTPWVKVVPFSLIHWKDKTPQPAEYFEEDIMCQAEAITGWSMDEVDLWRRLAQKKERFSLSFLKKLLDDEVAQALIPLEENLQEKSVSKMNQLWWDIAHFLKKEK